MANGDAICGLCEFFYSLFVGLYKCFAGLCKCFTALYTCCYVFWEENACKDANTQGTKIEDTSKQNIQSTKSSTPNFTPAPTYLYYEETNCFCKGFIIVMFIILIFLQVLSLVSHTIFRFFLIAPTIIWFTILIIYFVVQEQKKKEKTQLIELQQQKIQQQKYEIKIQNYQCNPPLIYMQNQMVANPSYQIY